MKTPKGDDIEIEVCQGDDDGPCVIIEFYKHIDKPDTNFFLEQLELAGVPYGKRLEAQQDLEMQGDREPDSLHIPAACIEQLCEELRRKASEAMRTFQ